MIASLSLLSALAAATLATSFVSGILGMAGGMMLLGVLLAALPVPAAMALHGVTQLASNGGRAVLLRREIDLRILGGYVAGGLGALAFFAVAHVVLGKAGVLIAMGLAPFAGLALPERLHLNVERRGHAFACGLACVSLALTAGVAGPLLDVFFVRTTMTRHRVVATKAATQTFGHLLKIVYFGHLVRGGEGGPGAAVVALRGAAAVCGTAASSKALERMSDGVFRTWTRRVIVTLGVVYLATGVHALRG